MDAIPEERWLPVVGWEGFYEVSDQGRVRSLSRMVEMKNGRTKRIKGRVLKPWTGNRRYPSVRLGQRRTYEIHRLVLAAFIGPLPPGKESCHNNGQPDDNRLVNLRYDTPLANTNDKLRHGTYFNRYRPTHCKRGHEFTAENTLFSSSRRICRTCKRSYEQAHRRPDKEIQP